MIKLTRVVAGLPDREAWFNPARFEGFMVAAWDETITLVWINGDAAQVRETPDEILKLMAEVAP